MLYSKFSRLSLVLIVFTFSIHVMGVGIGNKVIIPESKRGVQLEKLSFSLTCFGFFFVTS